MNSSFATIAASIAMSRSKPCSGIASHRRPVGYWDIAGRENPRKGVQPVRKTPRRRKTAAGMRKTARRQYSASAKINIKQCITHIESAVDAQVSARVRTRIFLKVDAVVKNGPQHTVGQAVVVFLKIVVRQIDQHIGQIVDLDGRGLSGWLLSYFAAPAEPEPIAIFERGFHRHRHAACQWSAPRLGDRDPVGTYGPPRLQRMARPVCNVWPAPSARGFVEIGG